MILGDQGEAIGEGRMTRGDNGRYRVVRGPTILCEEARLPTAEYVEAFYAFEREFVDAALAGQARAQPRAETSHPAAHVCGPMRPSAREHGVRARL